MSPAPPAGESASHVFGDVGVLDEQAVRLAVLVDPRFLAECGWDPAGQVLAPPPDHPQLGMDATGRPGPGGGERDELCGAGLRAAAGLARAVPRAPVAPDAARDIGGRVRRRPGAPRPGPVRALPGRGLPPRPPRRARRLLRAAPEPAGPATAGPTPGCDEARWRRTTSPVVVTGQVSLRRHAAAGHRPGALRAAAAHPVRSARPACRCCGWSCEELRRAQADSVHADGRRHPRPRREQRTVLTALARHAALGRSATRRPRSAKDVWDLAVFGLRGTAVVHRASRQPWLREAAKRWAADDLPRRRGDGAASALRSLLASLVAAVAEPARQPPRPRRPPRRCWGAATSKSFLHRLAYLDSTGQMQPPSRASETCREVKRSSPGSARSG